jgi:hypothetical protein
MLDFHVDEPICVLDRPMHAAPSAWSTHLLAESRVLDVVGLKGVIRLRDKVRPTIAPPAHANRRPCATLAILQATMIWLASLAIWPLPAGPM